MDFIKGRNNLSCTIFVPFDCDNHCPFCTSKKMYKGIELNPEEIIKDIKLINDNADVVEYVLTGGEPFANLEETKRIIGAMEKRCFINTTLPLRDNIDDVIDFINNEEKVRGINISRHIGFNFSGVADISIIDRIEKPVRINTVINNNFSFDAFKVFVKEWGSEKRLINLRADYTKLDPTSLRARDWVEDRLAEEYIHQGGGGCLVCHTTSFDAGNCIVQYHRGLMYSSVVYPRKNKTYINDVIITPDGNIYKDWNFEKDKQFLQWLLDLPDIGNTTLSSLIDWGDGKIELYYVAGNNDVFKLTKDKENARIFQKKKELAVARQALAAIKNKLQK